MENSNPSVTEDREFTVKGVNSGKELTFSTEVIVALVKSFLNDIPNDKRGETYFKMSLRTMRLHDQLKDLLLAEYHASSEYIEKKAKEAAAEELKDNTEEG